MLSLLSVAGIVGLCAGTFAAAIASRVPAPRAKFFQDLGGGLVVGSLALIGLAFAMV